MCIKPAEQRGPHPSRGASLGLRVSGGRVGGRCCAFCSRWSAVAECGGCDHPGEERSASAAQAVLQVVAPTSHDSALMAR